jgi:hypothetical protein
MRSAIEEEIPQHQRDGDGYCASVERGAGISYFNIKKF